MVETLIKDAEEYFKNIKICRDMIADTRKTINLKKASLWDEATGTVDAKKDYIKSKLAEEYQIIANAESEIEFNYNMIDVIKFKLEFFDYE